MTTTRTPDTPIAYLVAERRGGQWIIGDDWNHRCDTLDEARKVADGWRSHGNRTDPADIAVLAVTVVPETTDERDQAHGEALMDDLYRDWPGEPGELSGDAVRWTPSAAQREESTQ